MAMIVVAVVNYQRGAAVARRKMRWRLYGAGLGLVPVLCVVTLGLVNPAFPHLWTLFYGSCLAVVAAPIALTIAIVRYNLFDIDRLISATASYSVLCVLAVGGTFALVPRLAELLSDAIGIRRSIGQAGLSLALAGLVVPAHRRLRPQIDRIFFARRYAAERGLERLLVDLSAYADSQALLEMTALRLDELLEPQSAALYVRRGDAYEAIVMRADGPPRAFDASSPLIAALEQLEHPMGSDFAVTGWTGRDLSPFDRAALEMLGASIVVPVRQGAALPAFLSLGAKRSGDVYTSTDFSWLTAVANKLSGELLRIEYARRLDEEGAMHQSLRRYVPGAVADELDRGTELVTAERDVSVLFVDLRGYTTFSEARGAEEIFSTIDRYTETVSGVLRRHGGTVVEFAGDGMMAVFGAPGDLPGKERAAVDAGYDILLAMASLAQPDASPLRVGIGIASGPACVGNVHGSDRLIWTVIGNTPNLASRLQSLTHELDADMAIDAVTWRGVDAAAGAFECRPSTPIRGRSAHEDVYLLRVASPPRSAAREPDAS
jgi:class 3 adenylate cyclase